VAIDLNADVGEGFPDDEALIPLVTSVNVACAAHAGDASTIATAIERALLAGAAIGAHPSYPDREGFGRRDLDMEADDLAASLVEQIQVVAAAARAAGAQLRHVKPHGALYNRAARDPAVARTVARAVRRVSPSLVLVGLAGSTSLHEAAAAGLPIAAEAFADRRYEPDGRLRDRRHPDAVIDDPKSAGEQAVALVRAGRATTLCVHGDRAGAADRARAVRAALSAAGIDVRPLPR
jgi:UPF0271 protein